MPALRSHRAEANRACQWWNWTPKSAWSGAAIWPTAENVSLTVGPKSRTGSVDEPHSDGYGGYEFHLPCWEHFGSGNGASLCLQIWLRTAEKLGIRTDMHEFGFPTHARHTAQLTYHSGYIDHMCLCRPRMQQFHWNQGTILSNPHGPINEWMEWLVEPQWCFSKPAMLTCLWGPVRLVPTTRPCMIKSQFNLGTTEARRAHEMFQLGFDKSILTCGCHTLQDNQFGLEEKRCCQCFG